MRERERESGGRDRGEERDKARQRIKIFPWRRFSTRSKARRISRESWKTRTNRRLLRINSRWNSSASRLEESAIRRGGCLNGFSYYHQPFRVIVRLFFPSFLLAFFFLTFFLFFFYFLQLAGWSVRECFFVPDQWRFYRRIYTHEFCIGIWYEERGRDARNTLCLNRDRIRG